MPVRSSKLFHQERRLWSKVQMAHGKGKGFRAASREYLNSFACRYAAVKEAVKDLGKQFSEEDVQSIARKLHLWTPCAEEVRLHPKLKPDCADHTWGSYRYILSFGLENRARQILVRNLLLAGWDLQAEQYQFNGGREAAIKHLLRAYRKGYRHVFEIDVYHCFKSFDREGVAKYLSLPERVVTNVLSGDELNIVLSPQYEKEVEKICLDLDGLPETPLEKFGLMDADWGSARSGLTEGSKVSPFAAELLLAWVLKNVPDGAWRIVNYADNYLCLCKSENAAFELRDILQKLLHQHPAGPLKAKQFPKIYAPNEAFPFLGYHLVPKNPLGLHVWWSEEAEKKAKRLRRTTYKVLSSPSLSKSQRKVRFRWFEKKHWAIVNGYPSWKEGKQFHWDKFAKIKKTVL
ncbi:hypothetical protein KUW17_05665 [Leisingera aquaemixtae]|uniref:hypothetical protein n=1 Tax=Leisingera aquaemixtae TaxID=1396826 RepID=UPI001C940A9D|nr:hypothetical protein [Leisingera aquaemixtae]MBY6066220.1 hypothetical protein [Leisingera aquaemixtae]